MDNLSKSDRVLIWSRGFEELNIKVNFITDKCWSLYRFDSNIGYVLYDETKEYKKQFTLVSNLTIENL